MITTLRDYITDSNLIIYSGAIIYGDAKAGSVLATSTKVVPFVYKDEQTFLNSTLVGGPVKPINLILSETNRVKLSAFNITISDEDIAYAGDSKEMTQFAFQKLILRHYREFFNDYFSVYCPDFEIIKTDKTYTVQGYNIVVCIEAVNNLEEPKVFQLLIDDELITEVTLEVGETRQFPVKVDMNQHDVVINFDSDVRSIISPAIPTDYTSETLPI